MSVFRKKANHVAALLLFAGFLLQPQTVEQTNYFVIYQFGVLFPVISLRLGMRADGPLNIVNVAAQAHNFELGLLSLIAAYLLCFGLVYVAVRIYGALRRKLNLYN